MGGGGNEDVILLREYYLSQVQNQRAKNVINELFRPNARIGNGSTAAAVRKELRTGSTRHIQKATERITNIDNILRTQNLTAQERQILELLRQDLREALDGN